ncbi:hypothetical protein ACJO1P_23465 [Vibrio parahaemolyticus]|uniref:hypothetical protein n=1 Tax=Vibrio parahaemolyticus TaxID=670 RepID=UPI0004172064|nr:hypothetical protein [Vibrio parahaemolyticus]HCG6983533.1 hypothetical protein [Vibrio parahaemolyticus]HCG7367830.1 hypothetical protein [Vibrio parahaemolyticus]
MDTNKIRTITHRMMTTSKDELLAAITVRIEKSNYQAAVNSGNPIDYLAKNLKRHLKSHGISSDELWFSLELAYENDCLKNPHIHGTIKIKRNQYQDLLNALQGALGKPLVKSAARKRQVREVYSLDWADYCLKNVEKTSQFIDRRAVFIARPLTRNQSQVFGKNDFSKNAENPFHKRAERGSEKVLSSCVFNTPKNISVLGINQALKPTNHDYPIGDIKIFRARAENSPPNGQDEQLRKANGTRIQCRRHQDTET